MNFLQHIWQKLQHKLFSQSQQAQKFKILILEPILTPSSLFGVDFGSDCLVSNPIEGNFLDKYPISEIELEEIDSEFIAGFFTVGDTGKVEIEFLFDGWNYRGEVAIFNLQGMEELIGDYEAFTREAVRRSLSHSSWGYTLTRDRLPVSSFEMQSGDRFGIMFVPHGKVKDILTDSQFSSLSRPLFSLATDNFTDEFHFGQTIDLTGDGNIFTVADFRLDGTLQGDLMFKVQGALGKAPTMDELDNV